MAVFLQRLETKNVFVRPGQVEPGGGDADTLDGTDSSAFLGDTDNAFDSDLLDGKDSTGFAGRLFAVVESDGTLVRGNGATSASRGETGNYEVVFDRDVTECAYMATIGSTGSGGTQAPGSITVVGLGGSANGVFIDTEDLTDAQSTRDAFHLHVIC